MAVTANHLPALLPIQVSRHILSPGQCHPSQQPVRALPRHDRPLRQPGAVLPLLGPLPGHAGHGPAAADGGEGAAPGHPQEDQADGLGLQDEMAQPEWPVMKNTI